MLTLAKIAHPAQPTQNVHPVALPKMPLVDVPVVDHRTAASWWKFMCLLGRVGGGGGCGIRVWVFVSFFLLLLGVLFSWGKDWNIED